MDIYGSKLVNKIETKPLCVSLSNLADMLTMVRNPISNPIDFRGQRSKVKVIMDLYSKNLVNAMETEPLRVFLSNLADILTMIRG